MIKRTFNAIALLLMGVIFIGTTPEAAAQNSDEAKVVLRQVREKCQSIEGGHYVMMWKMKYLEGGGDTVTKRYT